jgi:predicted enzyme related to lactoylglutathione lyase
MSASFHQETLMITPHLHGKFVWFELLTQDIDKAVRFYDGLFGWRTVHVPMGESQSYPMVHNGEESIGGFRKGTLGVKSHWMSYLSVPDVDAAHRAALAAGCRIMMAPSDYSPVGRAAAIADPTGASFCVWRGHDGDPVDVEKTPMGSWFWNELWTSDEDKALSFYESMFSYTHDTMNMGTGNYYLLNSGGKPRAGICRSVNPSAKSMWLPYVAVSDCDGTARKVTSLGGKLLLPPRDIPGIGRYAIAMDPTGGAIAFITPQPA